MRQPAQVQDVEVPQVLFARQAIVDRRGRLYGYELLFRGHRGSDGQIPDAEHATSRVLMTAFAGVGFEHATGGSTAFLNVTERFLQEVDPLPLSPDSTVLELLEDTVPSPALRERLQSLRAKGFRIALDDFIPNSPMEPLLDVADLVKVDLRGAPGDEAYRLIERLAAAGHVVLAEKVEDQDEHDRALAAGAELFQGYFFCRPQLVEGKDLQVANLGRLQSAASLSAGEPNADDLEAALRVDPDLTLRLLRYLNSAAMSLPSRISSPRHGILLLGSRAVRQWVLLLLLAGVGEQRGPILQIALARARACELLAARAGADDTDAWFSIGLLSVADALAGRPMDDVVAELPLDDDARRALAAHEGPRGRALAAAIACERGLLPETDAGATLEIYDDAVTWADLHAIGVN